MYYLLFKTSVETIFIVVIDLADDLRRNDGLNADETAKSASKTKRKACIANEVYSVDESLLGLSNSSG